MALTRSQLMRLAQNAEYWREREARQREAYIRTEDEELAEINRIYNEMYRWAEREISAFYGRYADAEGIDITEAKKRVSQLDIKEYEELAKQYVADRDFSPQANAEMRLYNATMRINRLELLKAQIGLKLVDGINDIDKHWEKIATERATQEIIRQSGILGKTLTDTETARTAEQIVNADFYNANFSERIWSHMDNLRSEISIELQKGFIAGIGSRQMASNLRKKFDVSERDALRLARTELRRIQTDVAKDNYERNGIEEYEFMAVNPRACPICRELDGKIFKVTEMVAGENAPPIHPNCHCTTAPHIDVGEYEAWLNYLERGGSSADWANMSPTERQRYDLFMQNNPTGSLKKPVEPEPEDNNTELQDEAIEWYVSGDGMWINQYLRGRMPKDMQVSKEEQVLIDALEQATDKPLPKSIKTLWRSVDVSAVFGEMSLGQKEDLRDLLVYGVSNKMQSRVDATLGKVIPEKGFMSTTKDKSVAEEFEYFTGADVPMVLKFDTTKTTVKGKDLKDFDLEDDPQKEVLLHPNVKYKVNSIGTGEYEEGGKYILVEAEFV